MMKLLLLLISSLLFATDGFTMTQNRFQTLPSTTTTLSFSSNALHMDPDAYKYLLAKARECAFSDAASSLDAKQYLTGILELEGLCVSGGLAGHDLCDNVDDLAEIVAHLRVKAAGAVVSDNERSAVASMGTLLGLSLFFAALAENQWKHPISPLTLQEWIWSIQGGYFDDMVSHFLRNGGL